jgi:hypothetical protein
VSAMITRNTGDVLSEMKMTRTAFTGALLVVEGRSDAGFFYKRVAAGPKQIIIAGSKSTVIGAIQAAQAAGLIGAVGVVDDDYDSLCGVPHPSPNIVRTETRDLESLLIASPALDALLHEVADAGKVQTVEQIDNCPIRQGISNRTMIFGKLRLLNRQHGWGINFDHFKPWRFGNKSNWQIDEAAVITLACAQTGKTDTAMNALIAGITVANPYVLLHGRDTLAVLQIGLSKRIGTESFSVPNLCRMLRLAFNDQMAANCQVFKDLRTWEAANAPFHVLPI